MTFLLGLTGGIASGKSTVSRTFKAAGFPVVDADVIARRIVEPGQPVLARIDNPRTIMMAMGTLHDSTFLIKV